MARKLPRNRNTTITTRTKASPSVFKHLADRVADEGRGIVLHEIVQPWRKPLRQLWQRRPAPPWPSSPRWRRAPDRCRSARRAAVDARLAVEVLRADLDPGDIVDAQHRAVGIGAQHDVAELLGSCSRPCVCTLNWNCWSSLIGRAPMRPTGACTFCARIAAMTSRRRQVEAGQALRVEPDTHRVVQLAEQVGLSDAGRTRNRVEHVDDGVVGDEQRILLRHCRCRAR